LFNLFKLYLDFTSNFFYKLLNILTIQLNFLLQICEMQFSKSNYLFSLFLTKIHCLNEIFCNFRFYLYTISLKNDITTSFPNWWYLSFHKQTIFIILMLVIVNGNLIPICRIWRFEFYRNIFSTSLNRKFLLKLLYRLFNCIFKIFKDRFKLRFLLFSTT
jgi:hypothetical protein